MARRSEISGTAVDPESGFYVIRKHLVSEFEDTLAGPFVTPREAMVAKERIFESDQSTPLEIRIGVQFLSRRRLRRALRAEVAARL